MFLQDNQSVGVPDLDLLDSKNLNKRFKYHQKLRLELRKRFRKEYLSQLILKKNEKLSDKTFEVGDVVLIGSENKKRIEWPLGKVVEQYPGKDGVVRVVKLKTASGFLIRPVKKLYMLETYDEKKRLKESEARNSENITEVKITRSGRRVKLPLKLLQ